MPSYQGYTSPAPQLHLQVPYDQFSPSQISPVYLSDRGDISQSDDPRRWVLTQLSTFTNWVNEQLNRREMMIANLANDFNDGVNLIALVEVLQNRRCQGKIYFNSTLEVQRLANIQLALEALLEDGVKLVNIGNHDIAEGNLKLILGLIWCLILRYQIGDKTKIPPKKLMIQWLQAVISELRITNFKSQWSDGIALSALVEYCQPGLIPHWRNLDPRNRLQNCRHAMELARDVLGVPMILNADNMASDVDELSMMTYLSYFMIESSAGYRATLQNCRKIIPDLDVHNFTIDWNNGIALCHLVHNLGGQIPGWPNIKRDIPFWIRNLNMAINAGRSMGVEPILTAQEMSDPHVGHLGVMAYVAHLSNLPVNFTAPIKHQSLGELSFDGSKAYYVFQQVSMELVLTDAQATLADFEMDLVGPNGIRYPVTIKNTARGASLMFAPSVEGKFELHVFTSGQPIRNSPIIVNVRAQPMAPVTEKKVFDASHVSFSGLTEPCPAGSIVEVVINAQGSTDGSVVVEAYAPSHNVVRCPVQQRGSTYTATFAPQEVGEWKIAIFYDGEHIRGSPFTAHVYDANLVQVYGLDVGVVGQELKFNVNTGAAGKGDLKVDVLYRGRNIPTNVERQGNGLHRVQFTPDGPGQYKIHIYYNTMEVKGSPFILDIVDASSVSVYGDNLRMACVDRLSTFMIHAVGADAKDLTVTIMAPSGKRKRAKLVPMGDSTYQVEWKPVEAGEHLIDVRLYNQSVKGSPFSCNVGDPDMISVRKIPSRITESDLGERITFEIDASAAGSGNLEIMINGGRVACKVRELGSRCYVAQFIPHQQLTHIVDLKFNDESIKGSPFRIEFDTGSTEVVQQVQQSQGTIQLGGQSFILQPINMGQFPYLYGGQQQQQMMFGGQQPAITGTTTNTMQQENISTTQSTQSSTIDEVNREYASQSITVEISGRGISEACVGKVGSFEIGGDGLRSDDIDVKIISPTNKLTPCKVIAARTGNFRCEFVPTEIGTYKAHVAINREPLNGSPFSVSTYAPHKVFIDPIPGGAVGKPVQFYVDATESGRGELEISINQGRIPNNVQMQGSGKCLVTFIPDQPGTYVIDVTFNGDLVRGCPIRVEINDTTGRDSSSFRQSNVSFTTSSQEIAAVRQNISPAPTHKIGSAMWRTTSPSAAEPPTTSMRDPLPQRWGSRGRLALQTQEGSIFEERRSYSQQRLNSPNFGQSILRSTATEPRIEPPKFSPGTSSIRNVNGQPHHTQTTSTTNYDARNIVTMNASNRDISDRSQNRESNLVKRSYASTEAISSKGLPSRFDPPQLKSRVAPTAEMRVYQPAQATEGNRGTYVTGSKNYGVRSDNPEMKLKMFGDNTEAGDLYTPPGTRVEVREVQAPHWSPNRAGQTSDENSPPPSERDAPRYMQFSKTTITTRLDQNNHQKETKGDQNSNIDPTYSQIDDDQTDESNKGVEHVYELPTGRNRPYDEPSGVEQLLAIKTTKIEPPVPPPPPPVMPTQVSYERNGGLKPYRAETKARPETPPTKKSSIQSADTSSHYEIIIPPPQLPTEKDRTYNDTEPSRDKEMSETTALPSDVIMAEVPPPQYRERTRSESSVTSSDASYSSIEEDEPMDRHHVVVSGPHGGVLRVGEKSYISIENLRCKRNKLSVHILAPNKDHTPNKISKADNGYIITYKPEMIGTHKIHVAVDGNPIPDMPLIVKVYDPQQIGVRDIKAGVVDKPVEFIVDATKAGYGNLEIAIKDDQDNILPTVVKQHGQTSEFTVSFTPAKAVLHEIHVSFNGIVLRDSPFACPIEFSESDSVSSVDVGIAPDDEVNERDMKQPRRKEDVVKVSRDAASPDFVSEPKSPVAEIDPDFVLAQPKLIPVGEKFEHEFRLNILDKGAQGSPEVTVLCKPTGEKIQSKLIDTGSFTFKTEFTPRVVGDHFVHIKFAGIDVNGSPFTCRVYDASKIKVGNIPVGQLGNPVHFVVDASEAGVGNLEVAVNGGRIPSMAHSLGQHRYDISFVPRDLDEHTIGIRFNQEDVPGSPFMCKIGTPSEVEATVTGCVKGRIAARKIATVNVSLHEPRKGEMRSMVKDSSGKEVKSKISGNGLEGFEVQFTPEVVGNHSIEVTFDGAPIVDSPFSTKVYDSSKVKLEVVENAVVGKSAYFYIDAAKAGAGNMEIVVSVENNNLPNFVHAEGSARFKVSFTPQQPVRHKISVKFNDESVPGSPMFCDVQHDADSGPIRGTASGDGLHLTVANKKAFFVVVADGAAKRENKECNVVITAPSQKPLDSVVVTEEVSDSREGTVIYHVEYKPTEVGPHSISVQLAGDAIESSPFYAKVFDPDRVKVSKVGPALVNKPTRFEIDTSNSGEGTVSVEVIARENHSEVRSELVPTAMGSAYETIFVPSIRGFHDVHVLYNGHGVKGSPFQCNVFDHADCSASGEGLRLAQLEQSTKFEIQLNEEGLNEELAVRITTPAKEVLPCSLQKSGVGVFHAEYVAHEVGLHLVEVLFAGEPIRGSPYWVDVFDIQSIQVLGSKEGVAGKEHRLTVDHTKAGKGYVDTEITLKDKKIHSTLHVLEESITGISFSPKSAGIYKAEIKFNGHIIPGSQFEFFIADAGQIYANGPGLEFAQVDTRSFFVVHMEGAGRGELDVVVLAPNGTGVPVKCYQQKDGNFRVEYTPTVVGKHKVEITFADLPVYDSPYTVQVFDPTAVLIGDIKNVHIDEEQSIPFDRRLAGDADLQLVILDPKKRQVAAQIVPSKANGEEVRFTPTVAGKHQLKCSVGGIEVPAGMPVAHGEGLERAVANVPASFLVEAKKLKGDIKMEIQGPSMALKPEVTKKEQGVFLITYIPVEVGDYTIKIQWNGQEISGSPFTVLVVDPTKVLLQSDDRDQDGRIKLKTREQNALAVKTVNAGTGDLRAEVRGPNGEKIPVALFENVRVSQEFELLITPDDEGEHSISLFFSDYPVPRTPAPAIASMTRVAATNSRLIRNVSPGPSIDASRVTVSGSGLKEAKTNTEATFSIDGTDAGPGEPSCSLMGSRADVPVKVIPRSNGLWQASYVPMIQGKYDLHVLWSDTEIPNSPFKVGISTSSDASKVVVDQEPMKQGILGKDLKSTIDIRKAGPGKLLAVCQGPSKMAFCELYDHKDGTFSLNIKPEETGKHTLGIKFGDDDVPGSPYTLYISSPPDPKKVKVYGPGVEPGILSKFKSNFVVDTKGAGAGQLTVRVRGPKGAFNVEMSRENKHDRKIHCRYDPKEPGDYQVEVRWAAEHVPGSPFHIMIFDTQQELERFHGGTQGAPPQHPPQPMPFMPPGWVGPPPPGLMMGPGGPRGIPPGHFPPPGMMAGHPIFPPRGFPYASSTLHSNASNKWIAQGDY